MTPRTFADLFHANGHAEGKRPSRQAQEKFILNALGALFDRGGQLFRGNADPRRSVEDECGHPREQWTVQTYQEWYDYNGIAARTVEAWPDECWISQPSVYEDEDGETITPFEEAWDAVGRLLAGGQGLYQDEESNPVWNYLHEADVLSGIGRYGALLLGIDDGLDLEQPAQPQEGRRLLYLRAFPELYARVDSVDDDRTSSRYMQPTVYEVTLDSAAGASSQKVHWSRVLHVSESDLYHTPRMQQVRPQLMDLQKLLGGSAEMYWKGAFPGHYFTTNPSLAGTVSVDGDDFRDAYERFINGLERAMLLENLDVKTIAPQVVDPTPQIERQFEALCVRLNIPRRIFLGSERGELASSQDQKAHDKRVRRRQTRTLTPRLIVPFVERLIVLGVLPMPARFSVWWPGTDEQSETEKADKALKTAQALAQYVSSGASAVLPLAVFLTRVLGWSDEEAAAVASAAPAPEPQDTTPNDTMDPEED